MWFCGANGILIMQNSLSCTPILLLLEGKRGCFAWWLWLYCNAKVALLQHKQAGFVVLFLACSACWLCNILAVRRLALTVQNSRISRQRFCCALNEEYWALEMQISYLDMMYMFLDMKTWCTCFLDMKTWCTCYLDMKTLNKLKKKPLVAEVSGLRSTISGTIH